MCYSIFIFCVLLLTAVSLVSSRASPVNRISATTDTEAKNWRYIQKSEQRKRKNKKTQKARHLKLQQLNKKLQLQLASNVSQKQNEHLFFNRFLNFDAKPVTTKEGQLSARCSFLAADCSMELQEQEAVAQLITNKDIVLELGGRFGTTSCTIAHYQNNTGNLVVVEPDPDVWYILEQNQRLHHCSFWTFRGVVSHFPIQISSAEYATRAISVGSIVTNSFPNKKENSLNPKDIPFMDFISLQSKVNQYFTALLIDCEGCIEQLFALPPGVNKNIPEDRDDNNYREVHYKYVKELLRNVTTIIVETDMKENTPHCQSHCVNYEKWFGYFKRMGYKLVFNKRDTLFPFIDHVAFYR